MNRNSSQIKPGYELYQLNNNTSSSNNNNNNNSIAAALATATFSFTTSATQSTFQLKISIISAEVKNIVNVLKQVCILGTVEY